MAVTAGRKSRFCAVEGENLLGAKKNKRKRVGESEPRKYFKEFYSKWKQKHAAMRGRGINQALKKCDIQESV